MDNQVKERNGVVLHLDENSYQEAIANWSVNLPSGYDFPLEMLRWHRYVVFVVRGTMRSVAEVGRWSVETGNEGAITAHLILRSDSVIELANDLSQHLLNLKWVTCHQGEIIQLVMADNRTQKKPEDSIPHLDLTEATLAVARRFNVKPEQVEITVRSIPADPKRN
ncbi:hypothetical protein [Pseudomonas extremaustralis]|uniref:hypothetical protein n=1 Tax=Pseudomonas extremaustralis TaxID=359110 RepID=UPI00123B4481|nr:hypothetical protein [Pseudomonas extremaustralis]